VSVFFAGFEWPAADPQGADFLRSLQNKLDRMKPPHLSPRDVRASLADRQVEVEIVNRRDRSANVRALYGDGYFELDWPLEPIKGYDRPELAAALVAGAVDGSTLERRTWKAGLLAEVVRWNTAAPRDRSRDLHIPGALLLPVPRITSTTQTRFVDFRRSPALQELAAPRA
jgi:hypothetical protein